MRVPGFLLVLASALACTRAAATEPVQFLRSGAFDCRAQHAAAVERMADAHDPAELRAAVDDAIYRGLCAVHRDVAIAVTQVRPVSTRAGHAYVCFHEVDPSDHSDLGSYCSASQFVTTVAAEIERRKGDYTISADRPTFIRATCTEGGTVILARQADHWERRSAVFPTWPDPAARPVAQEREDALRAGCRGMDYRE